MTNADMEPAPALRRALVADLLESGALRDPRWIAAFGNVPRQELVPRFLLDRDQDGSYQPVDSTDKAQHREALELTYTDEPLVTEVVDGFWVSSSSQPSLMAMMLEALAVTGTEKVLEVGTGTGYNAALLCEALGSTNVVSVDIDPDLVETARHRLAALGYTPILATVDGAEGYPGGVPYDRIIATCSLPAVPVSWITQVREGGLIMMNLYRDLGGGALALLQVNGDHAAGRFLKFSGGFMQTRTYPYVHAVELLDAHQAAHKDTRPTETGRTTSVPAAVLDDQSFAMFAALRVPAQRLGLLPDDAPEQFWLLGRDGSWACQTSDDGRLTVVQDGPVMLWNELEGAYADWVALGRPPRQDFGLTVNTDGEHLIWHGTLEGPTWRL
jgi:methyltransferase of ATP-grasp peptide maturase system